MIKQLGEDIWDLGDEMTGQLKEPSLSIVLSWLKKKISVVEV